MSYKMLEHSVSEIEDTPRPRARHSKRNTEDDEDGLSEIELKNKLFESMKNKGILNSMKSQLRNKLVLEFNSNFAEIKHLPVTDTKSRSNLALNTVNSLIINHLKASGYDYSLSVFMPECGLNVNEAYTLNDVFQILKISNQSRLYKDLNESNVIKNRGLLWHLVNYFCSHYVTTNTSVQTEPYGHMKTLSSLDFKLRQLEKTFSDRHDQLNISGNMSIEERILSHQKRIEEQIKMEYEEKLNEFKENEFKKYKLEQKEKLRIELETIKKEYDQAYQVRFNSLMSKEKNIEELVKQKHDIEQRELFMQRQQLLDELKLLKERETEFKRHSETQTRSFENDLAKFKKFEDEFKKREYQLKLAENEFDQRLRNEREKIKFDVERAFTQREFLLQSMENKNKEETKRLDTERTQYDRLKKDLQAQQIRSNELELEVQKSRAQVLSLLNENNLLKDKLSQCLNYDVIKEENNYLKAQLETIKIHLGENYLQKQNQIKQIPKSAKSAFKPVQRKRSVTFANENNNNSNNNSVEYQNDSTVFQESLNNEAFEVGDHLLTVADNQLLLERKIEEHTSNNRDLKDLCEMQIYESRQIMNKVLDLEANMNFLQNGIIPPDDNGLGFPLNTKYNLNDQIKVINNPTATIESVAFLESAKERIKNLENEADKVERNYRDYQFRLTSMTYPIEEDFSSVLKIKNRNSEDSFNLNELLAPTLNFNIQKADSIKHIPDDSVKNVNSKNFETLKQISLELNDYKDFTNKSSLLNEALFKKELNTPKNNVELNKKNEFSTVAFNKDESLINSSLIPNRSLIEDSKNVITNQNKPVEHNITQLTREKTFFYDSSEESANSDKKPTKKQSITNKPNSGSSSSSTDTARNFKPKNSFDAKTYVAQLNESKNEIRKETVETKPFNAKTEIVYEVDSDNDIRDNKIERESSTTTNDEDDDDFGF